VAKGTVVAETDAIRVVHNVTIVTFDGAKAIVDGAEYGIASMVVDSIGVKGGLADNVIAATSVKKNLSYSYLFPSYP